MIQTGRLSSNDMAFPVTNLIGAILLFISLMYAWNLPSVIIEICWIAISIYGIFRIIRNKGKQHGK